MGKNSPFRPRDRRSSDGAIAVQGLSPLLKNPQQESPEIEKVLTFELIQVPLGVLDRVSIGEAVTFDAEGRRTAAKVSTLLVGFVPSQHRERIATICAGRYTAWISEIAHRSVWVSVSW